MYDMEDLEYYTQEAVNDLNTTGIAPCRAGIVVKVKDDLYILKKTGWDAKCHKFFKLVGDVHNIMSMLIVMSNGYKNRTAFHDDAPLFRADAVKLMEMGMMVAHERYPNVTFKMVDGKIYDHWEDEDEPDQWYDFEPKNYSHPDTLTNDEYIGWMIANRKYKYLNAIREDRRKRHGLRRTCTDKQTGDTGQNQRHRCSQTQGI